MYVSRRPHVISFSLQAAHQLVQPTIAQLDDVKYEFATKGMCLNYMEDL